MTLEPDFCQTCGFRRKLEDHCYFHKIFVRARKALLRGHFLSNLDPPGLSELFSKIGSITFLTF